MPIAAHALHNALTVVLDLLDPGAVPEPSVEAALASFRDLWWMGALGLAVSLPLLPLFFRRHAGRLAPGLTPACRRCRGGTSGETRGSAAA